MFRPAFWAALLVLGQAAALTAVDLKPEVSRLVRQLNSDELSRRDLAERQLIALGPAAAAVLPATNETTPAEVVQRLTRVRQAWERERARQAAQSSAVSLQGEMSLPEALQEITRQTGNQLIVRRDRDEEAPAEKITLNVKDEPFWSALDRLLDQRQLDVDTFAGEGALAIVPRAPTRVPRAASGNYSGPFRLEAARFEAVRDLRQPDNRSLRLLIDVAWEPRLRPILISQPLHAISAKAGNREIQIDGQGEPTAPIGDGITAIELAIPLVAPPRSVEKISSLRGKLKALVPGEVETFRFADVPVAKDAGPVKKVEQRKAAVTVVVEGLRKNNDVWELRVRVRFDDPANSLDSYLSGWLLGNAAVLEKTGEEPIAPVGFEQTLQTPNEVGVKYLYELPDGPQGLAFVYKSSTAVFQVPVEYELKDLDLP